MGVCFGLGRDGTWGTPAESERPMIVTANAVSNRFTRATENARSGWVTCYSCGHDGDTTIVHALSPEAERVCKCELTVHVRRGTGDSKDYLKAGTLHGLPLGWSQEFKSAF